MIADQVRINVKTSWRANMKRFTLESRDLTMGSSLKTLYEF